ncbi:MAG: MCP four helix bundle domain-containing protein [Proteobacteria bacterium]|nr:MCP four helix bundle domain-containing protein [Pseudomonadota bacterium]
MKINELKVGTRLGVGFAIVLLLLTFIVGIGLWRLHSISAIVGTMVSKTLVKERLVTEWAASTDLNGARTMRVVDSSDAVIEKLIQSRIKETSARISAIQKQLDGMEKDVEEVRMFEEIAARRKAYIAVRDDVFKEKTVNEENARALSRRTLEPALADYVKSIDKVTDHQAELIAAMNARIVDMTGTSRLLFAALGGFAVLFGIAVATLISRSIVGQLGGEPHDAVLVASRIAAGDLTVDVQTRPGDQESLMYAMKTMRQDLVGIVTQVRSGTDNIATASTQIATGNLDLSSRTEEQAASLEETASSMEEMTSTVQHNADSARQASAMASAASDVASKGGAVVAQVVDTMGAINDSSRKIVDIIGVIDGIAFQTNILALNAAVEAARAGEQGRGFAVVAAEVRSLAQRSAGAAKEIKALIDHSVNTVETGSALVEQAGMRMGEIVDSIRRVTDIMGEITAATQEQTSGIEQISQAITQMDNVTQQNAALVEQAAAASHAMQDQAAKLARVVSVFKLSTGAASAGQSAVVARTAQITQTARTARPAQVKQSPKPAAGIAPPAAGTAVAPPRPRAATKQIATAGDDWEEF